MNFGLSFTNPWALLLWPPLAFYFVWLAGRSLADLSNARRRAAIAMRLVLLTLIVLALAGLQFVKFNRDMATMFVVDYSDSVGAKAKVQAEEFINNAVKLPNRKANDLWGVVVFGRDAYIELAPGNSPNLGKIQTVTATEFTDIAGAIRLAMASLPDGMQKRIVILSDGNENLGDVVDEAQVASNNEVKIDVVPLTSPQRHEVLIEKMTVPSEAKIGEPIEVKAIVRSTQDADATLKLFRDGQYLGSRDVHLNGGEGEGAKNVFVFPQTVEKAGASIFEAKIEAKSSDDTTVENNRALGFVNVQGKPRVLLVGTDTQQTQFLAQALQREKVNVELTGAGGLPPNLTTMQPYDAIVLDNVPAWDMTEKQMLALQSYVRDLGCGLVMVGGEYSYGPGGYRETAIEETLPVTMDIKNMQVIPGGAVAMVMHSCEFQNGNDWTKSICSQVIRQLGENDWAGICVYGFDANWVFPGGMLKVGPNRQRMLAMTRKVNPGDMPDFDAALQTCYNGLIKTNAALKHCIIVSDGDPSPPGPALVAKFQAAKITVSTVIINPHDGIGGMTTKSMAWIAKQNSGRAYVVLNPKQIPNIFLKEAATVSRSAIIEETFNPVKAAESSILKGIGGTPPLLGYVGTTKKPTAINVLQSHQDDPVLATWQYGLGKAVAWTSDARQRWAAAWVPWSGYSKFWAQTVRWSMRQSSSSDLQTLVDIDKGKGKITIEAVDSKGNFMNFLEPKARLVQPNMKSLDLSLDQTGPGRYEANFDARQLGTYLVNIQTKREGKTTSQITGAVLPYSPEYGKTGTDENLLYRVRQLGGGDRFDFKDAEKVFTRPRTPARAPRDIWLPLLACAALLFPLDVAVRRLMWGETELQNLRSRFKRQPKAAKTGSPKAAPQRDQSMDSLLRAKQRAGVSGQGSESGKAGSGKPEAGSGRPEAGGSLPVSPPVSAPPVAPPPPGGVAAPPPPPIERAPVSSQTPPSSQQPQPAAPEEDEDSPMARLRAAKRRAREERGEE